MTMPAEVTSDAAWDRLITTLRAQYADIDELYQRITDPDTEADEQNTARETELMTDRDAGYGPEADDRAAELDEQERVRLDAETDGQLDGDYDIAPYDEPGLED